MIEVRSNEGCFELIIWTDEQHGVIVKCNIKTIQQLKSKLDVANEYAKTIVKLDVAEADLVLANNELKKEVTRLVNINANLKQQLTHFENVINTQKNKITDLERSIKPDKKKPGFWKRLFNVGR